MTELPLRLFFLTVVRHTDRAMLTCKTIAPTVEQAELQAAEHFGPLDLNSWGSRLLHPDRAIRGGGTFIPSAFDTQFSEQYITALSS